jgi:hypothetical protein
MPRPRQRACLQEGLSLNLNRLARRGFIRPGSATGPVGIKWANSYFEEEVAAGVITADMSGRHEGWFRIQIGQLDQWITLVSCPRRFGGTQWYFLCPYMNRRASVLWKPFGARDFACRQRWKRQVAYSSQFQSATDRAHYGQAKINSRLCSIGGFNPEEWDLPPKPKWMRWRTYNRAVRKFDHYEAILDAGTLALVAKLKDL